MWMFTIVWCGFIKAAFEISHEGYILHIKKKYEAKPNTNYFFDKVSEAIQFLREMRSK